MAHQSKSHTTSTLPRVAVVAADPMDPVQLLLCRAVGDVLVVPCSLFFVLVIPTPVKRPCGLASSFVWLDAWRTNFRAMRLSSVAPAPRRWLKTSAHPHRAQARLLVAGRRLCDACYPYVPSTGAHFFSTKPTASQWERPKKIVIRDAHCSQLFPFRSPFSFARRPSPTAAFSSGVGDVAVSS